MLHAGWSRTTSHALLASTRVPVVTPTTAHRRSCSSTNQFHVRRVRGTSTVCTPVLPGSPPCLGGFLVSGWSCDNRSPRIVCPLAGVGVEIGPDIRPAVRTLRLPTRVNRGPVPRWRTAHDNSDEPVEGATLADLLAGNGLVALTEALDIPGDQLAGVCQGQVFQAPQRQRGFVRGTWRDAEALVEGNVSLMRQRSGLTQYRLAQRLGIGPDFLAAKSFNLWGRTFSEERDRRAGPKANQQKRGRVSRELRAELEIALADGNDQ